MARNRMHKCWNLLKQLNIDLVRTSLQYTEQRFSEYTGYPSYEFKQKQIADVVEASLILLKIKHGGE